jgi:hypothetical protein
MSHNVGKYSTNLTQCNITMFLSFKVAIPLVDILHHATLFGLLSDIISTTHYQRAVV